MQNQSNNFICLDQTTIDKLLLGTNVYKNLSDYSIDILLKQHISKVNLYNLIKYNRITEEQIEQINDLGYLTFKEWWALLTFHTYNDQFVKKYENFKNWWLHVPNDKIKKFINACNYAIKCTFSLNRYIKTLKTFLTDFVKNSNWYYILQNIQLSEWFIELFGKYSNSINMYWWKISRYQTLSENFIKSNISNLDIDIVLGYQKVSEQFIIEYIDYYNEDCWYKIFKYQQISESFKLKYKNKI